MTTIASPLVRIIQTVPACPSEWFAWDADGNWYYLRYRCGRGSVHMSRGGPPPGADHDLFIDALGDAQPIAEFRHGGEYDGEIGLDEFLELAQAGALGLASREEPGWMA